VRIGYTPEQEALRAELRSYFAELISPSVEDELNRCRRVGPTMRRVWKQMCADGWSGIGWPVEYGGQGRTAIEQLVFFDESQRAGAPVPILSINAIGPTIMAFGTDEQKTRFLPGILNGDIHFCVGYSEPNAGTDLASLKTRAVRDGDEYVINGEKAFTSLATDADFVWMAARTDLEAAKHRGISIFVVPMDAPGVTVVPMRMLSEHDVAATFYADVRVPADAMVGGENNGWTMITSQLNHERVTLCPSGTIERLLEEVVGWAKSSPLPDGRHVIEQEWVRLNLARVRAKLEFLKLMNWKVAWSATQGRLDVADASTVKVFGTEFYLEAFRLLSEVIGEPAYLNRDSPGAVIGGRLESLYRDLLIQTFGGGTNEIQRDLIATFGLGMPRPPR
jgi:hypothetical protein